MIEYALYNWVFDAIEFGKKLKASREHAGLSREDVAKMIDVSGSTVATWESGRCSAPMPSHFLALVNAFDLDPREFYCIANTGKRAKRP